MTWGFAEDGATPRLGADARAYGTESWQWRAAHVSAVGLLAAQEVSTDVRLGANFRPIIFAMDLGWACWTKELVDRCRYH